MPLPAAVPEASNNAHILGELGSPVCTISISNLHPTAALNYEQKNAAATDSKGLHSIAAHTHIFRVVARSECVFAMPHASISHNCSSCLCHISLLFL